MKIKLKQLFCIHKYRFVKKYIFTKGYVYDYTMGNKFEHQCTKCGKIKADKVA